jgi:hypothetical protein
VDDYVRKGGDEADTEGRSCLCNALLANIGLAQQRDDATELPLYTGGDALLNLSLGSVETPRYDADDVIDYLYGTRPALYDSVGTAAPASAES